MGTAGNVADGSSPFAAAFGSGTESVEDRSSARATGAVSEVSSCDENGKTGRDVSSSSSASHACLNPITPTSVLAEQAMNIICFIGIQSRNVHA